MGQEELGQRRCSYLPTAIISFIQCSSLLAKQSQVNEPVLSMEDGAPGHPAVYTQKYGRGCILYRIKYYLQSFCSSVDVLGPVACFLAGLKSYRMCMENYKERHISRSPVLRTSVPTYLSTAHQSLLTPQGSGQGLGSSPRSNVRKDEENRPGLMELSTIEVAERNPGDQEPFLKSGWELPTIEVVKIHV